MKMNALNSLPELEVLQEYLEYKPDTGELTWIKKTSNRAKLGVPVGCLAKTGYLVFRFNGKLYLNHRVAWKMGTGEDPGNLQIDHANRVRTDNRLCNLRLATQSENRMNQSTRSDNTSGTKNVSWSKQKQKWQVRITVNGKPKTKFFNSLEEANQAVDELRARYHGEFAPE